MSRILDDMRASYGDLREPTYTFVPRHDDDRPRPLIAELLTLVRVVDCTFFDETFAYSYELLAGRCRGKRRWRLWISTVGSYACLHRPFSEGLRGREVVVCRATPGLSDLESRLVELIESSGRTVLDVATLLTPTPLRHVGDDEDANVFRALFAELDVK